VIVRINDRGPYIKGRIIDLTPAGAKAIGFSGLARVEVAVVSGRPA
jgi:rare lipoprotein A